MNRIQRMFGWAVLGGAIALTCLHADDAAGAKQQAKSFEKEITTKVKINYWLFLPKDYDKGEKKWPMILFLHGAGESGSNLAVVKKHGPPKIVEQKPDFPFIVVSPQSPGRGWNPDVLNALVDDIVATYRVDPNRVYLTGLSMGGYGTWALAAAHPEKFAAIAPICGGGDPSKAAVLKNLPIWVFHGAKDTAVPLARSEEMINALKAAGASPKFTVYPQAGHDSWTETYANPEFYDWLLQQSRDKKAPNEVTLKSVDTIERVITVLREQDGKKTAETFKVDPRATVFFENRARTLADLKEGMTVVLRFTDDKSAVIAIREHQDAELPREFRAVLKSVDVVERRVTVTIEQKGASRDRILPLQGTATFFVDNRARDLVDLSPGLAVTVRLNDDRTAVSSIRHDPSDQKK